MNIVCYIWVLIIKSQNSIRINDDLEQMQMGNIMICICHIYITPKDTIQLSIHTRFFKFSFILKQQTTINIIHSKVAVLWSKWLYRRQQLTFCYRLDPAVVGSNRIQPPYLNFFIVIIQIICNDVK